MKRLLVFTLIALLGLATPCYAAFPTEGSPWDFTPEPSSDSFADGFTNNAGAGVISNHDSVSIARNTAANDGYLAAWFTQQDHADSEQSTIVKVRIEDNKSEGIWAGPSCRHNEGATTTAADILSVTLRRKANNTITISYNNRVNGSHADEGTSNESWNYSTVYELKLSVTGTGVGGTTMYGWLDGSPMNTVSVSSVTAGDDSELSCGLFGLATTGTNDNDARFVSFWAEAYAPSEGFGQVISIMMTKIKNWFSKPVYAQGAEVPRYYICPNVGDGSDTNWYRPKISDIAGANKLRIGYDTEIRMIKQEKGAIPANDWALVRVTTTEEAHEILATDVEVFQLPNKVVSDNLSLVETQEVNTKLQTLDISTIDVNDTYQTLIKRIGAKCLDINEKDYKETDFLRVK